VVSKCALHGEAVVVVVVVVVAGLVVVVVGEEVMRIDKRRSSWGC